MTETLPATSAPADDVISGLEDFGINDMVMPRLQIDHKEGVLIDKLSGLRYSELPCIILGLIRSRVLWHEDPDFDGGPLCKSIDGKVGIPSHRPSAPFPWAAAGMDPAVFPEGTGCLCESCPLSQWGSHPKGDNPWCSEQYNVPVMMAVPGGYSAALLTLQRSSLGPIRGYATSFARTEKPMYTAMTTISLELNKKGSNTYAVPKFAQGADTDPAAHDHFLEQYRRIRGFLTEPRDSRASSAPTPKVTPVPVPVQMGQTAIDPAPDVNEEVVVAEVVATPTPAPTPAPTPTPVPMAVPQSVATPAQSAPDVDPDIGF